MPQDKIELDKDLDASYSSVRVSPVDLTDKDTERIDTALQEAVKVLGFSAPLYFHSYQKSPYEKSEDEPLHENYEIEGFTCAYCGTHRYHLPGQHDQCDHSPTGECS